MSALDVRGGGAMSVETEALLAEAVRLSAAAHVIDGWAARAAAARRRIDDVGLGEAARDAAADLDTAHAGFAAAGAAASGLARNLLLGGTTYGTAETVASWVSRAGERIAAGVLGMAAPALLLAGASAAAIALGPAVRVSLIGALIDPDAHAEAIERVVRERGLPILSDPSFVALVRSAADLADEFLAGLFRSQALFAAGSALEAPENANVLLAAAGVVGLATGSRALRETPVVVHEVAVDRAASRRSAERDDAPVRGVGDLAERDDAPVRGVGDLAERVPPSDAGAPQIRIERYDAAGGARWIVYSGGTVDFGTTPAGEPYDMTANVHGVADASALAQLVGLPEEAAASQRAVRAAMQEAGVQPGDPVVVVGHSAGGMVAANLAADPELEVVAAVNLGGPAAQVDTGDTPVLSVVHSEDLVPATGGSGVGASGRVEVERSVGPLTPVEGDSVPAHALERYQETAHLIDRSDDPRLREFDELVAGFTGGSAPSAVSYWHARRSEADASP
ncbi:hypothetical protein ACFPER_05185 [Agromyces aurantiacus]|uniref:Alpha/beta fold hydrolase n=1 Tax=Agromyces aurantiacus TaxID=165814 RepID=A0ABV9R3M3_9MICO|nr:hypothetical protein [Agromyces aurantiacus]MBM7502854.1 8-oxo-dGTP pyrophosphatase MutT (NUDIX family) [Agromyces aurantiacus]